MRKFLVLTILVSWTGMSHAQPWNLDVFMGSGMPDTLQWDGMGLETNSGPVFGAALTNSDWSGSNTELGVEVARAKAEYSSSRPNNISGTSIMATAKHVFMSRGGMSAYAGVGLGAINVNYEDQIAGYSNSEVELAGQITLGVRLQMTSNVGLFLEGRYIRAKDAHVAYDPPTRDADFRSKAIVIGLRRQF